MYSLDINFLNDRAERPVAGGDIAPSAAQGPVNWTPAIAGVIVGAIPLALVLGGWLFLQNRNAALQSRVAELDAQLAAQQAAEAQLAEANARAQQAEDDARALVTVFDEIKPWSAMLQNFQDTVPNGVQITDIQQTAGEEGTDEIAITGFANSFDDVNDFVLVLSRSPFIEAEGTRLVSANLTDSPLSFELPEGAPADVEIRVPQVVQYNIVAQVTELPASELIPELESTLAVGLTSRIQALEDRGAF